MVCTPVKSDVSSKVKSFNRMKAKYCNKKNQLVNLNLNMKKMNLSEVSAKLDNARTDIEAKLNVEKLRASQSGLLPKFCKKHLSMIMNVSEGKMDKLLVGVSSMGNEANKKKNVLGALKNKKKQNSNTLPKCTQINGVVAKGIHTLIDYLHAPECLQTEGIFRKTGNVTRQRTLKDSIHQGSHLDFNDSTYSPHDVATVLKQLISDLPEPLFKFNNFELYQHLIDMNSTSDNDSEIVIENVLKAYQLLMLLLPRENVDILERLLPLLHKAANVAENKMSASSLGVVFSPSLLCSRNIAPEQIQSVYPILNAATTIMIENSSRMFDIPREMAEDIAEHFDEMSDQDATGSKTSETDRNATELTSMRRISRSENNVNKCKIVKHTNRKTLKESLINHLSNLVKSKSRDTNEAEPEVGYNINVTSVKQVKTGSVDDILSLVKSDAQSLREHSEQSSAVFVVDLGKATTPKKSSRVDAIVDQLTADVTSPISISVGKMSLQAKKAIMTPGSRMPIYF